jgi:hypothetical protein
MAMLSEDVAARPICSAPPDENQIRIIRESLTEDQVRAIREKVEEEKRKREAEIEGRLRSLETRIRQSEEITHECRNEVRGLLEAFAREREAGEALERMGQNPKPLTKPKE